MKRKTATSEVISLMKSVIDSGGSEINIPEICNRYGLPVTHESIMVRITNNRPRFPGWDFYTRTCQQTQKKIIGARHLGDDNCPQHEYADHDNHEPMKG